MKRGAFPVSDLRIVKPAPAVAFSCQPGSHVRLRSGGPEMVVQLVLDDHALCEWEQNGATCSELIAVVCLERWGAGWN